MIMKKENQIGCAGVIVFNVDTIAMVMTPAGNWSFPKGKNNGKETLHQNALRELKEETGLGETDIEIVDGVCLDEYSNKGKLSIKYLIAKYVKKTKHTWVYDVEELADVRWVKISEALRFDKLKDSRKDILRRACQIMCLSV
jgi:8-oxo-dGTP pyrophosphatase MutT (NUDIX family)